MSSRKIAILVKPASRKPGIDKQPDGSFVIRVRAPAIEGRATKAAIESLAKELGVPKSRLRLLRGKTSRQKLIEVCE